MADALDDKFDAFYENSYNVAKVGWQVCFNGLEAGNSSTLYDLANEQPLWQNMQVRTMVLKRGASNVRFSEREKALLILVLLASMIKFIL